MIGWEIKIKAFKDTNAVNAWLSRNPEWEPFNSETESPELGLLLMWFKRKTE